MKIFRHHEGLSDDVKGGVIVLGNFDGFHKGHQTVIARAWKVAREREVSLSVLVVEPHPRSFFNPSQEDFRLTSFRSKAHLLEDFGVDRLFVLPFNNDLAQMLAQDFVTEILLKNLGIKHIFAGYDYHFGAGRGGNAQTLQDMSLEQDFDVTIVEKIMEGDHIYSSTNIRDSLRAGDVRTGANQLGHWWHVEGHVLRGDQRGRTINFPTANLSMAGYIKPKRGVYAVRVIIDSPGSGPGSGSNSGLNSEKAKGVWHGVANMGNRPTFGKDDLMLEAHIFDFDFDIYGESIKVEFVDYIRPEHKFDGLDSLREQITKDCVIAKKILSDPQNQRAVIPIPRAQGFL